MAFMALQAPGDDSAHLIYEFERRAYPVRNSLLTIGRDAASHILIREPAVSRNHAELRSEDGKFVLHPCGVNPTTVNGTTLAEPRSLAEGDKVEVGSAILTFTTKRLPLGVAVIEPAGASKREKDINTRRNTIQPPDRRAVCAFHVVGENLQLRLRVDTRGRGKQKVVVALLSVRLLRLGMHVDFSVEHAV